MGRPPQLPLSPPPPTKSLFPFPAALGWGWGGGGGKLATGSEEKSKEDCKGVEKKTLLGTGFLLQYLGHPSRDLVVRKLVAERRRCLGGEKIGEGHRKNNYFFLPPFLAGRTPAPHVRAPCVL